MEQLDKECEHPFTIKTITHFDECIDRNSQRCYYCGKELNPNHENYIPVQIEDCDSNIDEYMEKLEDYVDLRLRDVFEPIANRMAKQIIKKFVNLDEIRTLTGKRE